MLPLYLKDLQYLLGALIQALNFNVLDWIIVAVLIFYALEGYSLGFLASLFDFLSLVLSFALGLKFYGFFGKLLADNFSLQKGFANAFGFFIAAFLAEIILGLMLSKAYRYLFSYLSKKELGSLFVSYSQKINRLLGFLPSLASSLVLLSFLLTVIISLPFSPVLKNNISSSRVGSNLLVQTGGFEKRLNDIFGEAALETLNFLTIKPQSDEFVNLDFKASQFNIDETAEKKMILMVNSERTKRGLSLLALDNRLQEVARAHSEEMLRRGYFSHYSPEGLSPFDRLTQAGIPFDFAGENLALAPNVEIAMRGLMQSEGHRANILSPNFGKIGIGVVDGGIYGEMFSQEFTN